MAQFARKFREEIFRGRHLEKYEAVAMTQNVELAGRTNKLELEMDNAISGTIKCYSKLRKEYIKQRDTLPIDFLNMMLQMEKVYHIFVKGLLVKYING